MRICRHSYDPPLFVVGNTGVCGHCGAILTPRDNGSLPRHWPTPRYTPRRRGPDRRR